MKCNHENYREEYEQNKRKHVCLYCGAFRYVKDHKVYKWIEQVKTITEEF